MIHCGNRSFLEVMWQMLESESEMAKWEGERWNRAVIECNTTFWGQDGYECSQKNMCVSDQH